jgi:thiamine monophosphate kinase
MQERAAVMRIFGRAMLATGCGESVSDDKAATRTSPDDLAFSVDNMDLDEDPREDFLRFAAGG